MTEEITTHKHRELVFPFLWTKMDREDENSSFYNVEFTDDFGDIKKGDRFEYVSIYFDVGLLTAYPCIDVAEKRIRMYFKCVPSQPGGYNNDL